VICPAIGNPASCEINAVVSFLHAKNMSPAEIHRELCAVYGQNLKSEGTVRQLCGMFKNGRSIVHDEERSGPSSIVSDDIVQSERQRFTISELSCEFPQISRAVLYKIIAVRLAYRKFCARWVPKILMGAYKTQRMALALTYFGTIPQR
jgi:hypothetical protein